MFGNKAFLLLDALVGILIITSITTVYVIVLGQYMDLLTNLEKESINFEKKREQLYE